MAETDIDDDATTATDDQTTGNDTPPPADDTAGNESKTALEMGGEDDGKVDAPADFPEDWREKMAGGDEKLAKRLGRYTSPSALAKALAETQDKLRAGQKVEKPGEDASDEDIAAYRQQAGIPDTPEGYIENVDGIVIGDEDKELVNGFLERAHSKHLPPDAVQEGIKYLMEQQEAKLAEQNAVDQERRQETVDHLREEWGADYRANAQSAKNFVEATASAMEDGGSFFEALMGARLADGSLFGDNATAMKWLAGLAREANPAGFVAPSQGASQMDAIDAEINQIQEVLRTNRSKYDKDPAMQKRYEELLAAKDKLQAA